MSKIGLVVLLSFLSGRALSQDYFVFIGSDNRQPFYVRIDSQLYSSSPEGHLLLAPLKDGDYTMTIGFPGAIYPEKQYALNIHGKDLEFGLRRQDDGSWRLYDELGKNWVTAQEKENRGEVVSAGVKKDDAFSRMMAGVVHDTAVLYNTYAMEEALKDSPVVKNAPVPDSQAVARADSPVARRGDSSLVSSADSPVVSGANRPVARRGDSSVFVRNSGAPDSPVVAARTVSGSPVPVRGDSPLVSNANSSVVSDANRPVVRRQDSSIALQANGSKADSAVSRAPVPVRLSEKKTARSLRQVYTDNKDTIVVIIPRDTVAAAAKAHIPASDTAKARIRTPDTAKARIPAPDTAKSRMPTPDTARGRFTDTTRNHIAGVPRNHPTDTPRTHPADTPRAKPTDTARRTGKVIPYINSDCHNFATDYDVDRLRVKMLDAAKDEDRIAAARKVFKTKCFYTPQVRALSEVFTTDAGKFRFFEAAWPFAADEHFQELSALLTDPVYISKFRAMTGGQP